jgi:pimeloyl-ACP methyl ester carboxylesterase
MEPKSKGYNLSISVNDFDLSYDDVGEGTIPVIFLHGFPFDKTMWELQLEFFKFSYRLIACDIRGFGKSTDEYTPLSIDLFTDDLIKFMEKLQIEKAIVCGLSMGGYIALNAVKRFPCKFEALVLSDTQCIAETAGGKKKRYKVIEDIRENDAAKFNEGFIKSVFHPDSLVNKKEIVDQLGEVVFANSQDIIIQGLMALAERPETCSSLGEIKIPTLIICGREDVVTPLAQSEWMNAAIKGSKLQIIENAGHVSNLEQPHDFAKYLSEFLAKLVGIEVENLVWNE